MRSRRLKRLQRAQRTFEDGHHNHYTNHSNAITRALLGRMYHRFRDDILREGVSPGSVVLDGGCGTGILLVRLARERADLSLHGADLAQGMIAEALKVSAAAGLRDRVHFTQADLADLPYEDDTFDLIVSSLSLHHWQDIPAVMRGLARVLRPGGRLLVYDATVRVPIEDFYAAAADAFPGAPVSRTPLKRRWFSIPLLQRLSIDTDESHAVRNHTKLVTAT